MKPGPANTLPKSKYNEQELEKIAHFTETIRQHYDGEFRIEINKKGHYEIHAPELEDKEEESKRNKKIQVAISEIYDLIRPENSEGLFPNEIAFTCPTDDISILGTYGIKSDIAIAFYNINTKDTALAHITPLTDINSVCKLLIDKIRDKSAACVDITFISNQIEDNKLLKKILLALSFYETLNPFSNQISTVPSSNIAIDSKNGFLYTNFECEDLGYRNADDRVVRLVKLLKDNVGLKTPISMVYDGLAQKPQPVIFSNAGKKAAIYQPPSVDVETLESVRKAISSLALSPDELYKRAAKLHAKHHLKRF